MLYDFDLGSSAVSYDPALRRFQLSLAAAFAYSRGVNVVDVDMHSASYLDRLLRYWNRGFGILMPGIRPHHATSFRKLRVGGSGASGASNNGTGGGGGGGRRLQLRRAKMMGRRAWPSRAAVVPVVPVTVEDDHLTVSEAPHTSAALPPLSSSPSPSSSSSFSSSSSSSSSLSATADEESPSTLRLRRRPQSWKSERGRRGSRTSVERGRRTPPTGDPQRHVITTWRAPSR